MAVIAAVFGLSAEAGVSGALTQNVAATVNIGPGRVFAINCTQDVSIRAGSSNVAAVSTDFRIPQNQTFTFSTGNDTAYISLITGNSSGATYYIGYLSKF